MGSPVSFVLRIGGGGQGALHGQIEHIPSGAVAHFGDLEQAAAFMRGYLAGDLPEAGPPPPQTGAVVDSIFSFLRRPPATDAAQPQPPPVADQPAPPAGAAADRLAEPSTPVLDEAGVEAAVLGAGEASQTPPISLRPYTDALLDLLRPFLPPGPGAARPTSLSFVALAQRSLGLGGRRGLLRGAGIDVAELRGGWIEATVRCEIWAAGLDSLNERIVDFQAALLTAAPDLRRGGLLQLRLERSSESTEFEGRWWRHLDYSVLYEYRYQDTDGAVSLLARIPIHSQADTGPEELTTVTDHLVRWDSQAAPALLVRPLGQAARRLLGLSLVAYVPGGDPPGTVTQTLVRGGQTTSTSFSSLSAFRAAFTAAAGSLDLLTIPPPLLPGEAQATRAFRVGRLSFTPPIELRGADRFEVRFSAPAFPAASPAQVYLRALIG